MRRILLFTLFPARVRVTLITSINFGDKKMQSGIGDKDPFLQNILPEM